MIPKHVRRFLDARLADRSADPADRRDEQIVDDGIITSNDGRYIDAVLDGQTVCIGGTSPRARAHVEIGLPAAVLDLPARLAALADHLDEHARLSRPVSPPKEKSPWLSTPDADTSQHGYCDGLVEAAGRMRRLLAADTPTPARPTRPEDDGEGDQEVWLPPIGDALSFSAEEPCPHCSSVAHHLRTGRCGDCGRRPDGPDLADTAAVGGNLGRGWIRAQGDVLCREHTAEPKRCSRHLGHHGQHVTVTQSGSVIYTRPDDMPLVDRPGEASGGAS